MAPRYLLGSAQRQRTSGTKALISTENGCSADDVVTSDGRVEDTDRVMYLRNHLTISSPPLEGYPIRDIFSGASWITTSGRDGTANASASTTVDFKTQQRTPKLGRVVPRSNLRNAVGREP